MNTIAVTPENDANHPWYHVVLKMEEDLNKSEEAFVECPACGEVEYIYDRSCYRYGYPDRDVGDD